MQGVLEEALATALRREVQLTVAGRTDRGVHALGQVASHAGEPAPARSLNGILPDDLAVVRSESAEQGFDARRDARSRTYRYRVLTRSAPSPFERGRALWWPRPLDRAALTGCAAALAGTHDFTAFTPTDSDHVRFERRVLRAEWIDESDDVLAFVDRGRRLHAQHGARAGRHDAGRGRCRRPSRDCWRAARAARRGRRRPPTGSTWSRSRY